MHQLNVAAFKQDAFKALRFKNWFLSLEEVASSQPTLGLPSCFNGSDFRFQIVHGVTHAQLSMPKKKQRYNQGSATIDSDRFHTVRARTIAERAGHPVRSVKLVESVASYRSEQNNQLVARNNCRSGLFSWAEGVAWPFRLAEVLACIQRSNEHSCKICVVCRSDSLAISPNVNVPSLCSANNARLCLAKSISHDSKGCV